MLLDHSPLSFLKTLPPTLLQPLGVFVQFFAAPSPASPLIDLGVPLNHPRAQSAPTLHCPPLADVFGKTPTIVKTIFQLSTVERTPKPHSQGHGERARHLWSLSSSLQHQCQADVHQISSPPHHAPCFLTHRANRRLAHLRDASRAPPTTGHLSPVSGTSHPGSSQDHLGLCSHSSVPCKDTALVLSASSPTASSHS